MNARKRDSFRQKTFKGAVTIVILLQTACATQFPMVDRENERRERAESAEDDSSVMKGTRLGFLIGAGAGVIIGLAAGDDPPCGSDAFTFCLSFTAEAKAVIGGVVLGGVGMIVGGIIGGVAYENRK